MSKKRIRIRHPAGSSTIQVSPGSSFGQVAQLIEAAVPSLTCSLQLWKDGYPPRPRSQCDAGDCFPSDIDMIHVSIAGQGDAPTINYNKSISESSDLVEEPPMVDPDGIGVRRIIDADNSCLFNSIGYILLDKSLVSAPKLRRMVAQAVRDDPVTFTGAFLGKEPQDYIDFITDPKAWGGQIELLIFSRIFKTEIAAFDIIRDRVDIYGTGDNYKRRVFVIYDGIHYDALAFTFDERLLEDADVTQFSPKDEFAMEKARVVCSDQHKKKAFTDTSNFTLRCLVCQTGLKGANEAQEHAQQTGHTNFSEF